MLTIVTPKSRIDDVPEILRGELSGFLLIVDAQHGVMMVPCHYYGSDRRRDRLDALLLRQVDIDDVL